MVSIERHAHCGLHPAARYSQRHADINESLWQSCCAACSIVAVAGIEGVNGTTTQDRGGATCSIVIAPLNTQSNQVLPGAPEEVPSTAAAAAYRWGLIPAAVVR